MNSPALVHELLEQAARRSPDKVALVCGATRVTYGQLEEQANRAAHALRDYGLQRGDRAALYLDNSVEMVAAIFAVLKAGGAIVPINPTTKPDKLCLLLKDCAARALICGERSEMISGELRTRVPSLRSIIECVESSCPEAAGTTTWAEVQTNYPSCAPQRPGVDLDLASILYTSGTTGAPKGVMCDHSNVLFAVQSIARYLEAEESDVILSVLPLSFGYGLNQVFLSVLAGSTLILEKSFAYTGLIPQRIAQERVTALPGVPTLFALLAKLKPSEDLSSVRYLTNAAAALPEAHLIRLRQLFPQARVFSMYGLTEVTRALYLPPAKLQAKPDSVGIAIPGTEVWIEDASGRRAGSGEVGELVVRGRHVARGYWNNPEASEKRFRPGPLPGERVCYTGDLFRMDDDGFFYFVARSDDMIKTRGLKVCPREIEEVLYTIDAVVEAAVFGVADPVLGQAVEAVIVVDKPNLTRAEVLAHCRAHLEEHMIPREIHFCTALPRTQTGKVKKAELRQQLQTTAMP